MLETFTSSALNKYYKRYTPRRKNYFFIELLTTHVHTKDTTCDFVSSKGITTIISACSGRSQIQSRKLALQTEGVDLPGW